MDNEDVIRDQMENTRTSLTEKLQTLEDKVTSTVDNATANVSETVEAVKDTVQETVANVKDSFQETINVVKDSFKDSVDSVKGVFDIPRHVENHPWMMMGGSVALGLVLGTYMGQKHAAAPKLKSRPGRAHPPRSNGNGRQNILESQDSPAEGLFHKIAPELEKLKGLAIGALVGTFRDMVLAGVPETFGEPLADILNNVTKKLGGTPFHEKGPDEDLSHSHQESEKDSPDILGSRWARAN
jgi:ElaB/YqjD/DUF883 family membrane-anchored ribosome-binding protein